MILKKPFLPFLTFLYENVIFLVANVFSHSMLRDGIMIFGFKTLEVTEGSKKPLTFYLIILEVLAIQSNA
jgi:hypothetical protein